MDTINVLWMNNGDESFQHYVEEAKSFGLQIETCGSIDECCIKLDNHKNRWKAIIINAVCRMNTEFPKIGTIPKAIKKLRRNYRDIHRFVAVNAEKLSYSTKTRLEVLEEGEEKYLLKPDASLLFEAIKAKVANNPDSVIRRKYARVLNFFPEERLMRLLKKLEYDDISKDTTIPNECRKVLERLKKSSMFANMYISESIFEGLRKEHEKVKDYSFNPETYNDLKSINDFSRSFGLSKKVPIYVKRSMYSCTSVNQPGSHDSFVDNMIEQGKAPYATKALLMELLNIIEWCAQQNPDNFEL